MHNAPHLPTDHRYMSTLLEQTDLLAKTKELCETIIQNDVYQKLQADVEKFLSDDKAKLLYQSVHQKGEELHHKQHAGVILETTEIKAFEEARDALFDNVTAVNFMDAQSSMEEMQKTIMKYISLTLEFGKLPTEEEVAHASSDGCCGGGCNSGDSCCSN